jgi:hypothetical protein
MYLKKVGMFKNILVEANVNQMFYGNSIIDMYAKSKMIIDDVCRISIGCMHTQCNFGMSSTP